MSESSGGTMQVMGTEIVPTGQRGHIENLETPFPLIEAVPPMLAQDTFVQRMMPAFDEVLAPIISTLDCLDSYFDPAITPDDFLQYLSTWVNSHSENELSIPGLRHSVATVTITPSKDSLNSLDNIIQLIKDYAPAHLQLSVVVAS